MPVPPPDEEELLGILYGGIWELRTRTATTFRDEDFADLFLRGPAQWLRHARDVSRYLNAVNFSLPLVKTEVHTPEFLTLEAVRLFKPKTYKALQTYKRYLLGLASSRSNEASWFEGFKEACDAEWSSTKGLVEHLFVTVRQQTQTVNYVLQALAEQWALEKRVQSADYFDNYFSFGIPSKSVTQGEIDDAVSALSASDPAPFADQALRMVETGRLKRWLTRLHERALTFADPGRAAFSLAYVGDLAPDGDGGWGETSSHQLLTLTAVRTMESLPPDERFRILADLVAADIDLYCPLRLIADEGEGSAKSEPGALSAAQASDLRDMSVERLRSAAQNGTLAHRLHLKLLVAYWLMWGNEADVRQFLQDSVSQDATLLELLPVFVATVESSDGTSLFPKREFRADPKTLALVSVPELQRRLGEYDLGAVDGLTEQEKAMRDLLLSLDPNEKNGGSATDEPPIPEPPVRD